MFEKMCPIGKGFTEVYASLQGPIDKDDSEAPPDDVEDDKAEVLLDMGDDDEASADDEKGDEPEEDGNKTDEDGDETDEDSDEESVGDILADDD